MEEAIRSVARLQNLLERRDAQFMRFETENRKTTIHRIHGFVARFENWIHFTDLPSPLDKVDFDLQGHIDHVLVVDCREASPFCRVCPPASCSIFEAII